MPDQLLEAPPDPEALKVTVEPSPEGALRILAWVGACLAASGWMDVVLLWIPTKFGNPEWEFGTVSSTFDALPLGTIGLAVLIAAAVALGWRWAIRVAAVGSLLIAVLLAGALVLFALDVPLAWQGVGDQYRESLQKAMVKTGVLAAIYVALYAVMGLMAWRRVHRVAHPGEAVT